jgi:hypothetical protein
MPPRCEEPLGEQASRRTLTMLPDHPSHGLVRGVEDRAHSAGDHPASA